MTQLQLLEELCQMAERQIRIIRNLAVRLDELNGITDAERREIRDLESSFRSAIGEDAGDPKE